MKTDKPLVPHKGMRFYHNRVLDSMNFDGKSMQLYEVTRIARGTTYYRAIYDYGNRQALGSCVECIDTQKFYRIVKEILPLPRDDTGE